MLSFGVLRCVALVRTSVSEEDITSIIRMTRRVQLLRSVVRLLVTANDVPSSPILITLVMEAIHSPKRRILQELHSLTSQTTAFFIVTAVKTSNLT
jgi:hypothetical protein